MSTLADLLNAGRPAGAPSPPARELLAPRKPREAAPAPTMSSQDLQLARELAAKQAESIQDEESKQENEKDSARRQALEAAKNLVEARISGKKLGVRVEDDDEYSSFARRDRDRDRGRDRREHCDRYDRRREEGHSYSSRDKYDGGRRGRRYSESRSR